MAPKGGIPWGCKNCVEPLQALSSGLGKLQGAHFQGKFGVWVLQGVPFFHHAPLLQPEPQTLVPRAGFHLITPNPRSKREEMGTRWVCSGYLASLGGS